MFALLLFVIMSMYDDMSKNSVYSYSKEDFPDLKTTYDSLFFKSYNLIISNGWLLKKLKFYENEVNDLNLDWQLLEQTKFKKLLLWKWICSLKPKR